MAARITNRFGFDADSLFNQELLASANSGGIAISNAASVGALQASEIDAGEGSPIGAGSSGGSFPTSPMGMMRALGNAIWGSRKKQVVTVSAGTTGLIVSVLVALLGTSIGPFSIIHVGQILERHFTPMQVVSEGRMGKLASQIIRGDFTPGATRLGVLGRGIRNQALNALAEQGVTPVLDKRTGTFQGFELDPSKSNSPYNEKFTSEGGEAVIEELKTVLGEDRLHYSLKGNIVEVTGEGTLFSDTALKAMTSLLSDDQHPFSSFLAYFVRTRVLSTWTLAGFHPFLKLKANINAGRDAAVKGLADWAKDLFTFEETGTAPSTTSGVTLQQTDSNGNVTQAQLPGAEGEVDPATVKSFLTDPKSFVKTGAGAVASAVAITCLAKAVNDDSGIIKFFHVIGPMIHIGMTAISAKSQIESSQDIDSGEVGVMFNQLSTHDPKTGQVTSTWYDAAPIAAAVGNGGGIDLDKGTKDALGNQIPWLSWTDSAPVNAVCNEKVQLALGAVSVAMIFIPGVDVVSEVAGIVGGIAGSALILNTLPNMLAAKLINVRATGAEWGNYADYGARFAANENCLQYGCVALNDQQAQQANAVAAAQDTSQYQTESLADRLLNPDDYRSLVGSMIDSSGIFSISDMAAKLGDLPNVLGSLLSMPASLLTASAHAASPKPYDYPFPEFGFSQADVNNPVVADPFHNADVVGQLLDNEAANGQSTYVDKALDCFGMAVSKGTDGWEAVPTKSSSTDGQDRTYGVNMYDGGHYSQSDCIDENDTNWLRIRFWLLDLSTLEGYACTLGDEQSCENSGFTNPNATTEDSSTTGNVVFYSQRDPAWGSKLAQGDGWSGTFAQQGCYYTDEAMIFSTFQKQRITPDMVNHPDGHGGYVSKHGSDYGLKDSDYVTIGYSNQKEFTKLVDAVKAGSLVILHSGNGGAMFDGSSNHWIVLRGVTPDGHLLVNDPWDAPDPNNPGQPKAGGNSLKQWDPLDVMRHTNEYRMFSK